VPSIALGNVSVISMVTDPETGLRTRYRANHIDQSITHMAIPPTWNLLETLTAVTNLWNSESDAPPAWLSCPEDPELESILQKHFNCGGMPEEGFEVQITGEPLLVPMDTGIPNVEVSAEGGEPA
jgi:hypothetical protein